MKKIFFIFLLTLGICFNSLKAANLSLGFLGQFAISGASTNSSFPGELRDFDTGFYFTIGMNQKLTSLMSFSLLANIGYYHDSYDFKYDIGGNRITENYQFDSFLIGASAKMHFSFFSLGIGGGAKIPISSTYKNSNYYKYALSFGDMKDIFKSVVIPYVTASVDFSVFNYLLIGLYVNYDFPIKFQRNTYMDDVLINKNSMTGFDVGIQFGYYINFENNDRI